MKSLFIYISFLLFIFICIPSTAQTVDHFETVVYNNDHWRFFVGTSEPPQGWMGSTFNDSSWNLGIGGIGYGDGDDNTQIDPVNSVYIRHQFNIIDTSIISLAILHADYDDAFVAYLNGIEFARSNIGEVGTSPAHFESAYDDHEAVLYTNGVPEAFNLFGPMLKNLLKEGINTLAIQIHNVNSTSSDLSSNFFFSVGVEDQSMHYRETPSWFISPIFSTTLPLIIINTTLTSEIYDEPRVPAHMGIIDNGPGQTNSIFDEYNGYDGRISIEIRGASSQMFPKKNYGFETQHEDGGNNNIMLLGLPKENDWVLHGPYADKSLLRNVLAYHMGETTGRYAPRTRLCEVFINNDYRGIYVLTERIKRDKNRVDIAKIKPEDISGDELTGGYIIQIDRDNPATSEDGWTSSYPDYKFFAFDEPDYDDIMPQQKQYIKNYLDGFEGMMYGSNYEQEYENWVDIESWVDYFLVTEVAKHIDAFKLSFFMYKKKDSNGGKLHFGPLWDFNLGFGNFDFDCPADPYGWSYKFREECASWHPFWVPRLAEIPKVSNMTNCRWKELREGPLKTETLLNFIDEKVQYTEEARDRNFERWPVLGTYVWPNNFIGNTYEQELTYMKNWLVERLTWMDNNMLGICGDDPPIIDTTEQTVLKIYPIPCENELTVDLTGKETDILEIKLWDMLGYEIETIDIAASHDIVDMSNIPDGVYVYRVFKNRIQIRKGKLVKVSD